MKTLWITTMTLGFAVAMFGQNQGQTQPKDRMVVQDLQTGQKYEVKAPANTVEVHQTGPNSYDVKVNREATKKIGYCQEVCVNTIFHS